MDRTILSSIPFHVDADQLAEQMRVRSGMLDELRALAAEAASVARPQALYTVAFVDDRGDDYVVLDGVKLTSRVLCVNLEQAHRVFVYTATAGVELDAWAAGHGDLLRRFWAEAINELGVHAAMTYLAAHLTERYGLGPTGRMNPGSLPEWPISQQRPLFELLGDTASAIGVRLTPSLLMTPTKSVSGILFPTEMGFASCMLCPREECRNRRAPYDAELWQKKYKQTSM